MLLSKFKQSIVLIAILFITGNFVVFKGLTKGREMAINLTRPRNATYWHASEEMILGYTYVPVIIGISLIILSLAFSTVLFMNWIKEDSSELPHGDDVL